MITNLAPAKLAHVTNRPQRSVLAEHESANVEAAPRETQASEIPHGIWRGTQMHICADGYCETATFGYGDDIRCARCEEFYSPARDEII